MTQATQPTITVEANINRAASIKLAGEAYSQSGMFSDDAKTHAISALAGCDFPMYETLRDLWKGAYMADRNQGQSDEKFFVTDESARQAWSRMLKDFAIEVPKSTTPEATEKAIARAAEKAKLAAIPVGELTTARAAAVKLASDALAVADAANVKKAAEAQKTIATLDGELKRRHDEANKPMLELMAKKREAIRKALNTCDLATLGKIETLLNLTPVQNGQTVQDAAVAPLVPQKPEGRKTRQSATV